MSQLVPTVEVTPNSGPAVTVTVTGENDISVSVQALPAIGVDVLFQPGTGTVRSMAGWLGENKGGAALGGGRVVTIDRASGGLVYVDPTNPDHASGPFGITYRAVQPGAVDYALTAGYISGLAFALPAGTLLFCGANGTLVEYSSLPGVTAFDMPVGSITSPTEFAVCIAPTPILKG